MDNPIKLTFLEALEVHNIVIPVIQRDYAQGRDNVQAENIREAFVQRLTKAAWGETLNLDLVYMAGKDENEWVPVDGQQRLTTLFLFHLYHLEDVSALKRFSYEVRTSSVAFCEAVVKNHQTWLKAVRAGQRPSVVIRDQAWFLVKWERDPTVMGMLRTLDAIHEDAVAFGIPPEGWEANITFWAYTIDEKADDAYCDLNARGKTLTSFENLKAYLDGRPGVTAEWKEKIDGDWLDALWGAMDKTKDPEGACDTALLTLTVAALLVRAIEQGQMAKKEDIQAVLAILTDSNVWLADDLRKRLCDGALGALCQDFAKVAQDGGVTATKWMTAPWDKPFPLIDKLARLNNKQLTYADLALLYAYWEEAASCPQWRRVIHNILENATVDSAETLVSAIRAIKKLAGGDLWKELNASTFAQEQCKEEARKLDLIDQDEDWELKIQEAEKLPWQKGRIAFLLEQSKKADEKGNLKEDLQLFHRVKEDFEAYFENKKRRLDWLRNVALPRIEADYNPGKNVYIPCALINPGNDDQNILKGFLYPNMAAYGWQIASISKRTDTDSAWRSRLDWLKKDWCDASDTRYVIRTWQASDPGVYFYTRAYLNDNTAYRIDKSVDWWYALDGVEPVKTKDKDNAWCLLENGTCVEVTWRKETLRLIQCGPVKEPYSGVKRKLPGTQGWSTPCEIDPTSEKMRTLESIVSELRGNTSTPA